MQFSVMCLWMRLVLWLHCCFFPHFFLAFFNSSEKKRTTAITRRKCQSKWLVKKVLNLTANLKSSWDFNSFNQCPVHCSDTWLLLVAMSAMLTSGEYTLDTYTNLCTHWVHKWSNYYVKCEFIVFFFQFDFNVFFFIPFAMYVRIRTAKEAE